MAGRTSIRTRLTLVYGATFFAVSTALVVGTYVLVRRSMTAEFQRLNLFDLKGKGFAELPPEKVVDFRPDGTPITFAELRSQISAEQHDALQATTSSLLYISIAAAVAGGVLALAICWLTSGRVIRPLRTISETASSIAGSSLDRRIRLDGPPDELKRLADTFDAMLERLDRSFDGQRRFVGNASHELRTPLTVSRALIQVAMDRPGATADLRELGTKLLGINDQQTRLTEALLTLARTEQELTDIQPVDLAGACREALDRHRNEATRADVELMSSLAPAVVAGDVVLLTQLVDNLVANAIAYNHRGGHVTVSTSTADDRCVLVVENTGEVIDPDAVDELFEPFRRLGIQRVTRPGVGLGLSIVRSIAHAHRGQISASTPPAGGLAVRLELPESLSE